ncbi:MAG: MoxR family ATPase [Lachnospiraceae bacterium]|nr:MoxR family ATPase [Lachnospiraceae bacterium]
MDRTSGLQIIDKLENSINSVIIGKEKVVELVVAGVITSGHILIEDTPGTGKTLLARTLAASIDGDFRRIQFTPDLLPADITGLNIFDQAESRFEFVKGPIFTNILLADEINRATPRTQSALLEAMEERQVTVDGTTHILGEPFVVIATENPVETAGTFPLPEAQLDRFVMHISMGNLSIEDEIRMLKTIDEEHAADRVMPVCSCDDIISLRKEADAIFVHDDLREYIVKLVQKTREHKAVQMGVSPRGTLWLLKTAKAWALMHGREYVLPDDVKEVAGYVLPHRMLVYAGRDIDLKRKIVDEILKLIEVPAEDWGRR